MSKKAYDKVAEGLKEALASVRETGPTTLSNMMGRLTPERQAEVERQAAKIKARLPKPVEEGFYWTIVAGVPQPLQELAVREFRSEKWYECGCESGCESGYWADQFEAVSPRLIPPTFP